MQKYCIFLLWVFQSALHAWWPTGHRIAAEIAYQNLTPKAKASVDELLQTLTPFYPNVAKFSDAATWADDLRYEENFRLFDRWHYTQIPYDPEKLLSAEKKEFINRENKYSDAVWAIDNAIETLSNKKTSPFTKALMLHLLIHAAADIHQPLHCCTGYSSAHPEGDLGGNLFRVQGMQTPNLHQLWDSGVGLFSPDEKGKAIETFAKSFITRFPQEYFGERDVLEASFWRDESFQIASRVAYQLPENTQPSEKYINESQKISMERITLSGYRLARVLNKIYAG